MYHSELLPQVKLGSQGIMCTLTYDVTEQYYVLRNHSYLQQGSPGCLTHVQRLRL